MSFDGFFLHHMVEELRRELVNGRIQKINQPFEQELVLQIRSNRQSHRLLLLPILFWTHSADPNDF